ACVCHWCVCPNPAVVPSRTEDRPPAPFGPSTNSIFPAVPYDTSAPQCVPLGMAPQACLGILHRSLEANLMSRDDLGSPTRYIRPRAADPYQPGPELDDSDDSSVTFTPPGVKLRMSRRRGLVSG